MQAAPIEVGEVAGGFEALIGNRRHVVIAVSGGADSTALMLLLASWRASTAGAGPALSVATVDHRLREASAAEAEDVATAARHLGLSHTTLRWDGPHPVSAVQATAREARYRLLIEHARTIDADGIALAHTSDDQAETFLMRLARGSGLEGLAAMRPESRREGVAFLRPLLAFPKSRLIAMLRAGDHTWIEDPSNADERFERVRIRKFLAQAAAEIGLSADKIALSARRLGDAEASLGSLHAASAPPPSWGRPGGGDGGTAGIGPPPLPLRATDGVYSEVLVSGLGATDYLVTRTLRQLIRWYGGAGREPELAQLESLARLLRDDEARRECGGLTLGGCKIDLLGDRRERIRIYREGNGENIPPMALESGSTVEWDGGRFWLPVPQHVRSGARVEALGMARWAKLKKELPALEALRWPAAAAATLPVILRGKLVIAYPAIPVLLNRLASGEERLHAAWRAFDASCEQEFQARFRFAPEW